MIGMEGHGIQKAVHESIKKCEIGIRKDLLANIVLSGGTTMFPYITERLKTELEKLTPT